MKLGPPVQVSADDPALVVAAAVERERRVRALVRNPPLWLTWPTLLERAAEEHDVMVRRMLTRQRGAGWADWDAARGK